MRLVARPDVIGVITGSREIGGVLRYDVFHDNRTHGYFGSQVEVVLPDSKEQKISAAALRAGLTSELIRDKNTSYLHARNVGRIDYEPYQFRPVLKIVQADRPRLLIADDVGVGKTIEACLILKELQARHRVRSVLIICPKPLVVDEKWRNELKRFDEDFVHLDGSDLRFCIEEALREGEWPARFAKAIVPYSLLDERLLVGNDANGRLRQAGLVDLAGPRFDLVIVDEAHHIRNRATFAYQNVKRLTASAEAVVLLSATPLQTQSRDLFTLVNLLRDDLVPTERDFAQMLEPNHHLYEAIEAARGGQDGWQDEAEQALNDALSTTWGRAVTAVDPRVELVRELLTEDPGDARARVRVVRTLEELNTFSSIVSRTRRRDIGTFTTRKPSAPVVPFTPEQEVVYNAVIDLGRRIVERQTPGMPVAFLLSMLRRQAASSISGLAPLVEQVLENRLDKVEFSEIGDDAPDDVPPSLGELRAEIRAIGQLAEGLNGLPDPKVDVLRQLVTDKQAEENNKVLVFSTFRHTLRYLQEKASAWGVRVGVVHGAVPDEDRHSLRRRFKLPKSNPDAIDLMLCSEVGTEGLDYQFCNTLVNYDIPWNPMRIEQRIGRIDRRGQQSESVAVINILTEGTIEAEIYDRCLLRIGVFHRALGGSERILGDLTTELRRIADDLFLSDADREERLRQIADNEVARIQELERIEDQQGVLLGLTTESFESRVAEASSEWLSDEKVGDLVRAYLEAVLPGRRLALRPNKVAVVRLDENAAARVSGDLHAAVGGDARLERQLRRKPAVLRVTTDPELAADDTDVELLSATHPLVLLAAQHAALPGAPMASLRVRSDVVPPGSYPIAVHAWTRLDVRDSLTLRYISTDPAVEVAADSLLTLAVDGDASVALYESDVDALEQRHQREWEVARNQHVARARAAGAQRVASLRAQRDRQLHVVQENADKVSDPKIVKMRQSELIAVRDKFDRLIAQHERAVTGADLITRHLATVSLEVEAP
ncbi:DEAD/DEAH box helicase [Micromonospora yasonensis]|uniref:DEAD/DEAH box helicase n=1 Tax=Micromonospora yasonensis TaxID=1128667 RepID=UPI002231DD7B|nr:DEAD/DEAH box helicase [Micromonospora yasonensis]MCW3842502.1 DEAD/DEAH box helicase [Micromonospora yasonensis]